MSYLAEKLYVAPRRKIRQKWERIKYRPRLILSMAESNKRLKDNIAKGIPFAAGKIGYTELLALRYYEYQYKKSSGQKDNWFPIADELNELSGVFPTDEAIFTKFCDFYESNLNEVDYLGVWFNNREADIINCFAPDSSLMPSKAHEPWYHDDPWSAALEGKTILAVHPFEETILQQKDKLQDVWGGFPGLMPDDVSVKTLCVPQYAKLVPPIHNDWFQGLDDITNRMQDIDFDIAIIGAGAWSLPLAVAAKKMNKIGIHLGGSSQLLFGIKGDRWTVMPHINKYWNEEWVNPLPADTPQKADIVEGGCYW